MSNRMNFEIGAFGEEGRPRRFRKLLTLETITKWIRALELDEYTTNGLIEMASRYPTHALPSFRKNINVMINRVRVQRQREQQGEINQEEQE